MNKITVKTLILATLIVFALPLAMAVPGAFASENSHEIAFEVENEAGDNIKGAEVSLWIVPEDDGPPVLLEDNLTDESGKAVFEGLEPDNYIYNVWGKDYADNFGMVEVADSDDNVKITLRDADHEVVFDVVDGESGDNIGNATIVVGKEEEEEEDDFIPVGLKRTDDVGESVFGLFEDNYFYTVLKEGYTLVEGENIEVDEDKTVEVNLWDEDLEPQINALKWDGAEPAEDTSVYYNYYDDANNVQFVVENAPFADNVFADFSHLGGETVWADEDDGVWKFNWDWDVKGEYRYPGVHHIDVYMEPGWEYHPIGHFIVVNINPLDMDFGLDGETTDWKTEIEDFTVVENLAFEMGETGTIGKLVIEGPINLCDEDTAHKLFQLGEHLEIARTRMSLDTAEEALAEFDGPATLHMYDLPFVETPSIRYISDEFENEVVVDDGDIENHEMIDNFEWDSEREMVNLKVNNWSTYEAFVEGSSFVVSDFTVSPETVQPEETAMVSAVIKNWGDNADDREVELLVDGNVEDDENVELDGGESTTVSFEVSRGDPGVYEVMIKTPDDNESGTFTIGYIPEVELSPVENFENVLVSYDLMVTNPPKAENAIENVIITPPPDFDDHEILSSPNNWENSVINENKILFSTDSDPIENGENLIFEFESKTPVLTGVEDTEYFEWVIETKDEENLLLSQKYATLVFSEWRTHEGYVRDLDGTTIEGAEVRVQVERPHPRRSIERYDQPGWDIITDHYADSGGDGYFQVENIPPGIRFRTEVKYFDDERLTRIAQRPLSISEDIFRDLGEVHYHVENAATVNLSVEEFGGDDRDNFFYSVTDRATGERMVDRTFVQESESIYLSAERSYTINV